MKRKLQVIKVLKAEIKALNLDVETENSQKLNNT